jgi:hypothetical protein
MKPQTLLLCLALAGCQTAAGNPPALPASDADTAKAKAALLQIVKDPDSAKFSKVQRVGDYICGMVNAKNSFGGYTGPKPFSVGADGEALIGGESVTLGVWASPCWAAQWQ